MREGLPSGLAKVAHWVSVLSITFGSKEGRRKDI